MHCLYSHAIVCPPFIDCRLSPHFKIQDKMKILVHKLGYVHVVWELYFGISNLSPKKGSG